MGYPNNPVRRIASTFGLRESLTHIWFYGVHIGYRFGLPFEYAHSRDGHSQQIDKYLQEFHLDLHAREIILYGVKNSRATRNLRNWDDLAAFHNAINDFSNKMSGAKDDIWLTLHRIGHQQVPYFERANSDYIGRHWLLFRQASMAGLLESAFGLTAFEYMLLVAGVYTVYLQRPEANLEADLGSLGLPPAALKARIASLASTAQALRDRLTASHRLDTSWAYTFNPLVETPLLCLRANSPDTLFCPRPTLVVRRLLAGAYFDLVKTAGFPKAFGDAVEAVVGELLQRAGPTLKVEKPTPYTTGGGVRHGSDWRVSDATGQAFVECKSARIPLQAQVALAANDVVAGMGRLAAAIAQNYSNIADALAGKTEWVDDGRPVFSLVVTLEDWILFSPLSSDALDKQVREGVAGKGLPTALVDQVPYIVVPVNDLPDLTDAMSLRGCGPLLTKKSSSKYRQYQMSPFLNEVEPELQAKSEPFLDEKRNLFAEFERRFKGTSH